MIVSGGVVCFNCFHVCPFFSMAAVLDWYLPAFWWPSYFLSVWRSCQERPLRFVGPSSGYREIF